MGDKGGLSMLEMMQSMEESTTAEQMAKLKEWAEAGKLPAHLAERVRALVQMRAELDKTEAEAAEGVVEEEEEIRCPTSELAERVKEQASRRLINRLSRDYGLVEERWRRKDGNAHVQVYRLKGELVIVVEVVVADKGVTQTFFEGEAERVSRVALLAAGGYTRDE